MSQIIEKYFPCQCKKYKNSSYFVICLYDINYNNLKLTIPLIESLSHLERWKLLFSYICNSKQRSKQTKINFSFFDEISISRLDCHKILQILKYDYIPGPKLPFLILESSNSNYLIKLSYINDTINISPQFNYKIPWYKKLFNSFKYLLGVENSSIHINLKHKILYTFAEFIYR